MLLRLLQTTKALCCAVTLALLLQAGGLGCALGCARAATVINQHECHASTSNTSHDAPVVSASFSAEHACCHRSTSKRREAVSQELVQIAEMTQCCLLADRIIFRAVKQPATTDKASANSNEKLSNSFHFEFRALPIFSQARLPDRGGTYLRCRVLLI